MNFTENEFGVSNSNGVSSTPSNIAQSNSFKQQDTNYGNNSNQPKKGFVITDNLRKIIIGVVAVVVVILGFFAIKNVIEGSKVLDADSLTSSSAFAIKDKNDKYAIFNNDGTKLTDFIYENVSEFFNGNAIVTNEKGEYGLISQSGKMIISFGKYTSIQRTGALYKLRDKNYDYVLATSTEKIVSELKKETIYSEFTTSYSYYTILENDNSYMFYDYTGTKFLTITKNKSASSKPFIDEKDELITISYNGKNYMYNVVTGKKIVEFDSSDKYCIYDRNDDNLNEIILQNCTDHVYNSDSRDFKFIQNNSIKFETKNECDSLSFDYNSIICSQSNYTSTDYIFDRNGNKSEGFKWFDFSYNDFNGYVKNIENTNNVGFYKNGKLIKTVECFEVGENSYSSQGIYTLVPSQSSACKNSTENYHQYFKSNGDLLINNKYQFAETFDVNGLAIVYKIVNKKYVYTLIDKSGKAIIDGYDEIGTLSFPEDNAAYYTAKKGDTETLFDSKGKSIVSAKKISRAIKPNDTIYFILNKNDTKTGIYDIKAKKEIITINGSFNWNEHYVQAQNGSKLEYYTYSGKLFYTK